MALDEEQFARISSIRTFRLMLEGAIRRYELLADLVGFLRLDVLIGAGVTFQETSGDGALPPKPGTPTFERIMGREPVPLAGPRREEAPATAQSDEEAEAARNRIEVSRALIWEAARKRKLLAESGGPPPEPEPSPPK